MASRESINRIKIEEFRASRVPINPATTIFQGDQLAWDSVNRIAIPITAASAASFMGLAEGRNPLYTRGSLTSDPTVDKMNVIQEGLVELIMSEAVTLKPLDLLTPDPAVSVQHVKKTGATAANQMGVVATENDFSSASGKAVVSGDLVLIRLRVPATLKMSF